MTMKKNLFKLSALLLSSVLLASAGQQADAWKEYVYNDDGFAVSAPVEPQLNRTATKSRVYVSRGKNGGLAVLVMNVRGKSDQEMHDMMKEGLVTDRDVVASSIEEITFVKAPALRAQKQDGARREIQISLCVNGRAFILQVSEGPEGERFINSFRLVESQWKPYSYPADGFALSSPAEPQVNSTSSGRQYTIDLPHGDGFLVTYLGAPPFPDAAAAQNTMLEFRNRWIERMKGKLTSESSIPGEYPAIAFEFVVPDSSQRISGRLLYTGTRIYFIFAKGHADAPRFFESFKIMGGSK